MHRKRWIRYGSRADLVLIQRRRSSGLVFCRKKNVAVRSWHLQPQYKCRRVCRLSGTFLEIQSLEFFAEALENVQTLTQTCRRIWLTRVLSQAFLSQALIDQDDRIPAEAPRRFAGRCCHSKRFLSVRLACPGETLR